MNAADAALVTGDGTWKISNGNAVAINDVVSGGNLVDFTQITFLVDRDDTSI
jgi:hypothetical protein